jgi:predicted TIM-barrel fold metal-dependent hydrolase
MDRYQTLENDSMQDIGPSFFRKPEEREPELTEKIAIVSADGHIEIGEDIFYENFPEHLKHKAPRIWFDQWWRLGNPEDAAQKNVPPLTAKVMKEIFTEGLADRDVRYRHMQAENIHKEILFPQSILLYNGQPDLEVRETVFRIYNEWLARIQKERPGVFYGVGVCSNWWDPEKARDAIQQIKDLGLKTFMIPNRPGNHADGTAITYGSPRMEPFWDAVAEAGLPVCFHIAEGFELEGRGVFGALNLFAFAPFRLPLGHLIFGGVFDRHPDLQVVFAEGGISWVPSALQDAEAIYDSFGDLLAPRPLERPSHYWHKNCYATFQNDRLGLELLHYIGADRVLWAEDYPHPEGSFGYGYSSRDAVINSVSEADAAKILGGTAISLFNLND